MKKQLRREGMAMVNVKEVIDTLDPMMDSSMLSEQPWSKELQKLNKKNTALQEKIEKLEEENAMLKKQKAFLQSKCREK